MEAIQTKDGAPMKAFLFLSFCLFLISCDPAQDCKTPSTKDIKLEGSANSTAACPVPEPTPDPLPEPEGEVPEEAYHFDASVKFMNFDTDQAKKVETAIDIIKKVIASAEFRTHVLNFTYNGKRTFVDNGGLTNEQIYLKLLKGAEKLLPEENYEMDLELELYYSSKSTVGYTYPNTVRIWMNTKFFNVFTPAQVAGNVFHEWTHKLGFDHASSYSVSRDSSVPYALGYLMRDLGKKYE